MSTIKEAEIILGMSDSAQVRYIRDTLEDFKRDQLKGVSPGSEKNIERHARISSTISCFEAILNRRGTAS